MLWLVLTDDTSAMTAKDVPIDVGDGKRWADVHLEGKRSRGGKSVTSDKDMSNNDIFVEAS